jgi:tRNA A-37 threonylcarbamoyl transferase component Bud32
MAKILKELSGHSGSKIYLMEDGDGLFVRKVGNTTRNIKRLRALKAMSYAVPQIYRIDGDSFDMEYIHGLDMKNYLAANSTKELENFLLYVLRKMTDICADTRYDFTRIYEQKLSWLDSSHGFPFTKEELIARLPKILPRTSHHGDFTLENIIHSENGFYMIDAVSIEYESYIFDIAKLRQDLECRWFLRNDNVRLGAKLNDLQNKILEAFPEAYDDNLLILMLLRVYLHTQKNDSNYKFIMKEIKRLWK